MNKDTRQALALILAFWMPLAPCAHLHAASYHLSPANELVISAGLTHGNAALNQTNVASESSLIINGTQLELCGQHSFTELKVINGGILRVTPYHPSYSDRGWLYIAANSIYVDSTSSIVADRGGYDPALGYGGLGQGGQGGPLIDAGGGGYGGRGASCTGGYPYGDASSPSLNLGSGGGNLRWVYDTRYGGPGGGAIILVAEVVSIKGRVSATGATGQLYGGFEAGAGSGGGVLIFGDEVLIRGSLDASGGNANFTGPIGGCGGGGGRIKVFATWRLDTSSAQIQCSGGAGEGRVYGCRWPSESGTIFVAFVQPPGPTGAPPSKDYFLGGRIQQSGSGSDPVNTATGNFYLNETDLTISGPGMDFGFTRAYNSEDSYTGPFGPGWTHSYNAVFANDPCNSLVRVKWGDGRADYWNPDGQGGYEPNTAGLYDSLTKNPNNTWTVTQKDQTRYEFDTAGKLSRIVDKNGNAISLSYDGSGLLDWITDTAGRVIDVGYNADGLIQSLADPNNRQIIYGYTQGKLTSVTDANGNTAYYTYDPNNGLLKTITDRRGIVTLQNIYDPNGRAIQQINGRGKVSYFSYDSPNENQTTITDPLGRQTIHTHYTGYKLLQSIEDPCDNTILYTYDENANHTGITDKNGYTRYFDYDDRGNVVKMTAPPPDPNDPSSAAITIVTYDPNTNNPLTKTEAFGSVLQRTWIYEYDPNGNLTKTNDPNGYESLRAYTANGLLSRETDANNRTTKYTYDAQGNLTDVNDALGNITHHTYDEIGRMIKKTDARGSETIYNYDKNDNLLTTTDPNGKTISYSYDENSNKTSFTDRRGNKGIYEYNENNILIREVDPNGFETVYGYDDVDNRTSVKDKRGKTTKYTYDTLNRLIDVNDPLGHHTSFSYDPKGNRISQTNGLGKTSQYKYDALDRLIEEKDSLGNATRHEYDLLGRKTAVIDAKGNRTSYEYDVLDRLVKVADAMDNVTRYEYDPVGNLISIVDANDRARERLYDDLNRLIYETDPLGNTTEYRYDTVGNLTERIDAIGRSTIYKYDKLDRLIDVNYPDGTKVAYSYDDNGNRIGMTDWNGQSTFVYDKLNRITANTDAFANCVEYEYDPVGNRTAVVYSDGNSVAYTYDDAGRLQKVSDWKGNRTDYFYDAANNLRMVLLPNWTWQLYGYDDASRLIALTNLDSNLDDIGSFEYTLDPVGNRIEINESGTLPPSIPLSDDSYSYDDADRLITGGNCEYDFDDNGNQITRDDAGLVTNYSYDAKDLLIGVGESGSTVQHIYDGRGNRIARTVNSIEKRYVLDLAGAMSQVLCETDAGGNITAYYIHGAGLLARITPDGAERYYHYDGLGSTVALTDEGGFLTDQYSYEPFGELANSVGSTENPFKYVGRYGVMTEPDGTLFMRARFYDQATGRFLSRDPAEKDISENMYLYADNCPTSHHDPLGLYSVAIYDSTLGPGIQGVQSEQFRAWADVWTDGDPIPVENVEEAAQKLKNLRDAGIQVDDLYIIGHGGTGQQKIGDTPVDVYDAGGKYWMDIAGVVKEGGRIHLLGCYVGQGTEGKQYMQRLANAGRREVRAWTGFVYWSSLAPIHYTRFWEGTQLVKVEPVEPLGPDIYTQYHTPTTRKY